MLKKEWDAVTANGILGAGCYYDLFAFRNERFPFGAELMGDSIYEDLSFIPMYLAEKNDWLPVYSAFGGLGIYKRASIIHFSYEGHVTNDLRKDYKNMTLL